MILNPVVSIILPTYNRPQSLETCLRALSKLLFQRPWEVIVVDDGSDHDLSTLINGFKNDLNILLIQQNNNGPASARNHGVTHAKGKYIAFIDDDCEPNVDWLTRLIEHASEGVMVGGKTINKLKSNSYSETSQLLVSFLYQYFKNTPWYFFTSNNFLVDKQSFINMGGFDESFKTSAGEDREFCIRWKHFGHSMHYCNQALIWHAHDQNFHSFRNMHFKYGKASVTFMDKTKELKVPKIPFRIQFYLQLLSYPFQIKRFTFFRKCRIFMLMFLSQIMTAIGYFMSRF